MPLDGARAEEQPSADLYVGHAVAGETGDLCLLRRELVAPRRGTPADLLARCDQLAASSLGERLHANRSKHVVRRAQMVARLSAAVLTVQPLTVEQVRAC